MEATMLSSLSRRCLRHLAVVFTVALCAGHAAAQSNKKCPDPPAMPGGTNTVKQPQTAPTASETPIWKTITVGGLKEVNATRAAIEAAPCPIWVGEEADEILGRPAFPFLNAPVALDLVVFSAFELGFGDRASSGDIELGASVQASLQDIYASAISLGFELCPAEVGPALRLSYLDQPFGEFLHIAMKPVARYGGELIDFTVGSGGAGLLLVGGNAYPGAMLPASTRFVFVRPRTDTLVSRAVPRLEDDNLAKR